MFDAAALYAALDSKRHAEGLSWAGAAAAIWDMAPALKTARFATGMALAMRITQWVDRPAADFIYRARW